MPVKRPRLNENNKRSIVIPLSQKNAYLGFYDDFRANTIFRLYFNSQKEIISLFLLFLDSWVQPCLWHTPPPIEVGASRSSTATRTVSTSYPRVSHGSCFGFTLMLFSYLHFVCLQQRLYLCYDVLYSKDKSILWQTVFLYRNFGIHKHCIFVNLQRIYRFWQVFFRVLLICISEML